MPTRTSCPSEFFTAASRLDRDDMTTLMTPEQCRAARGLLRQSQTGLVREAGLGISILIDFEKRRCTKPVETRNPRARRSRPCQGERKVCQQRLAPSMRTQRRKMLELGRVVLQNSCNLLKFLGHFSSHFTIEPCKLNGSIRTLTSLILVRIQVPQPIKSIT